MDLRRYQQVIKCCQLRSDLDILPHGDKSVVGENGMYNCVADSILLRQLVLLLKYLGMFKNMNVAELEPEPFQRE